MPSRNALPPLDLLVGFESAARHLSFTKAGEELYLTQSAVSRQIKELEDQLGVVLFQRRHRALALTEAGHQFYAAAAQALSTMRAATDRLRAQTGRKALAVTTPKSSPLMPGVPPLSSLYPGFEATNWYGIFAPAGTPAAIVEKISMEIAGAIKLPDVREFMAREGAEPVGSTPHEFAAFFRIEVDRYARVIRSAYIRGE